MINYIVRPLTAKPGIQRDGTAFASQSYIDGQWCRFYMGRPRKIGGYKLIDAGNNEIITSLFGVAKNNSADIYLGRASSLKFNRLNFDGEGDIEIDRTPTTYNDDFPDPVARQNNIWDFDIFIDADGNSNIVAAAIPNRNDINNVEQGFIYYGSLTDNLPLQNVTAPTNVQTNGGILFLPPIMIAYGSEGTIQYTDINGVLSGGSANWGHFTLIANTKIIKAYTNRSTTGAILAWTSTSLISAIYTPEQSDDTIIPAFASSIIQDGITVISPNSIIPRNQQFFWMGVDQFYYFDGVVQTLKNDMSTDYIFNNLDLTHRSKVFGISIPRYNELWWFYVSKDSPNGECDSVAIINLDLNVWHDSKISRASGLSPGVFPLPIMCDSQLETIPLGRGVNNSYGVWMHEFGVDKVIGNIRLAIESYYETPLINLFESNPSNNRLVRSRRVESDFVQTGNMTVTVNNRMFPSQDPIPSGPYTFSDKTPKVDLSTQGRFVSFVFSSNEAGGGYQAGQPLLDYEIGDVNP